ncbi:MULTISPECIES: hypothetical protein [Flavobacterium]|uniref:Urea amidohydrolase n=1 Tax=Flavobacterium lipolyticum TaxID=2893754 RepID=A0ABS8M503_9FLAO|nr:MULTISPECIES: hypothetical protein [unclassified Flavobacterium]MCC9019266.1 hypothetical protein [Flavobacterium sp. F-126]
MQLTPKGYRIEMLDHHQKENLANDFIHGFKNVSEYINGVCYETVAYVQYLLHPTKISLREMETITGKHWVEKFTTQREWTGETIPAGTAIGFYRINSSGFFHFALGAGGTQIRAVNGLTLGSSWTFEVNLPSVLGPRNEDGTYNYDNSKIRVYLMYL